MIELQVGSNYILVCSYIDEKKAEKLKETIEHYTGAHIIEIFRADSLGFHFIKVDSESAVKL